MRIKELSDLMLREENRGPHAVMYCCHPADGFILYGPFPDRRAALDWMSVALDDNGWVVPLEKPKGL